MTLQRTGFSPGALPTAGAAPQPSPLAGVYLPQPSSAPAPEAPLPLPLRPAASGSPARPGLPARGRSTRRGRTALAVALAGFVLCVGMAVVTVPGQWPLPGGRATVLGSVAALSGTYLCLGLLVLVARVPWIEREVGQDRLVALHRRLAPWSIVLIAAHVLLTTVGYAQADDEDTVDQFLALVLHSAWMMPALTALVLFVALGVMSYRRVREHMRYETWWAAHLYFYLAVALAFGHQVELGTFFVDKPLQKWFWTALYLFAFGLIVVARFLSPLLLSLRHDLRVAHVVNDVPGVVSVVVSGRRLRDLDARGGQYFQWRFMTRHWWWQAHPYSLSASPDGRSLRITVKDLGDQSGALAQVLTPGMRVWAEGPYGVFTADRRSGDRVVAFAAGVGVTPVRALLEDLPLGADVDVVVRVRSREQAPLGAELDQLAAVRGFRLRYLEGTGRAARLRADTVLALVPDLAARDVYVCGPEGFTAAVLEIAHAAGVPADRVHHESFAF